MANYTVCSRGSGQFTTLSAALAAIPADAAARITLRNGVYREKLYCEHENLTIVGESREGTLLVWSDGAYHRHKDGRPNGTFRSYTAYFSGGRVCVKNMTIANTAGDGSVHGQTIAAAVDAKKAHFQNVTFLSCQDTLFTGPLPESERLPNGFLGPKQHAPRMPSCQYYENCYIRGDIDFIFGGADALFENCTLHCRQQQPPRTGYIAAPSTAPGGLGYVFYNCKIQSEAAPKASFYLARPWRSHGRAAFIKCDMGNVIHPSGFDDWDNPHNRLTSGFAEYKNTGPGARGKRAFGTALTTPEAEALLDRAAHLRQLAHDR